MVIICFIGIFIGTCAFTLIASIMNGFEKITHKKLQGIHAQLIMRSPSNQPLDAKKIKKVLNDEFSQIEAFSASSFAQAILQKDDHNDLSNVVLIKAINPEEEMKVSTLEHTITASITNTKRLTDLVHTNAIIIGNKLAQTLQIKPGDSINILFVNPAHTTGPITLDKKSALVAGIFSTGIEEFDLGFIFASVPLVTSMFPDLGVTQFTLQLKPNTNENHVISLLKKRFNLEVFSWKDLYPALVAALKLEKYSMSFILTLITLVASMSIISLLFMQITQKRSDIAIYQAMGMSKRTIKILFMAMGVVLCMLATLTGLIAAYGIGSILKRYPFISLPDTYYVSHLPIEQEGYIFVLVFIVVFIISLITTWIACRSISSIEIAKILRFE